jgi:hypothetical protein
MPAMIFQVSKGDRICNVTGAPPVIVTINDRDWKDEVTAKPSVTNKIVLAKDEEEYYDMGAPKFGGNSEGGQQQKISDDKGPPNLGGNSKGNTKRMISHIIFPKELKFGLL